jgi:hypothetical protein
MKLNYLPFIVVGLTIVVGVNLWVIERDAESFERWCSSESAQTQSLACYPQLEP